MSDRTRLHLIGPTLEELQSELDQLYQLNREAVLSLRI